MFPLIDVTLSAGLLWIRRSVTQSGCMYGKTCIKMESADECRLLRWGDMKRLAAGGAIRFTVRFVAATGRCSGVTRAA